MMMMKPISSFLSLLPLTLCLFLLPYLNVAQHTNAATSNARSATNLIKMVCEHSAHKQFCISSLESDPNSQTSDITGLAVIALKLASSSAANTTAQIKKLLSDPNLDPFVEQCLSDCSEHYLDAVDQIDDSLAALSVNAYHDIDTWVNAAIADAVSCEEGFKDQPGHPLVLTHNNKALRQLCNNALVIAKLLPAKH